MHKPATKSVRLTALLLTAILLFALIPSSAWAAPGDYHSEAHGITLSLKRELRDQIEIRETDNELTLWHKATMDHMGSQDYGRLLTVRVYNPKFTWLTDNPSMSIPNTLIAESRDAFISVYYPTDVQYDVGHETEASYKALRGALTVDVVKQALSVDHPATGETFTYVNKTDGYSLELPSKYADKLTVEEWENVAIFYHTTSLLDNAHGHVFSIKAYSPRSTWVSENALESLPNKAMLAVGDDTYYVGLWPTDVQCTDKTQQEYRELSKYFTDDTLTKSLTLDRPGEALVLSRDPNTVYLSGDPQGNVRPDAAATRAEIAQMLYNLAVGQSKAGAGAGSFTDVESGAWYADAINYLGSYGVFLGYTNGQVRPVQAVTRAELITMLHRALHMSTAVSQPKMPFSDVPSEHWAWDAIASGAMDGWVSGYSDGTFRPDQPISRAEAITIINRALGRSVPNSQVPSDVTPFTDLSRDHWAYGDILGAGGRI